MNNNIPLERQGSNLQWVMASLISFGLILALFTLFSLILYLNGVDKSLKVMFEMAGGMNLCFLAAWIILGVMRRRNFIRP